MPDATPLDALAHSPARELRVLWIAVAWGRGHLMRAHLMRQELPGTDIVTTSEAGVRFLSDMGSPSRILSDTFQLAYDERQNLRRGRTMAACATYAAAHYGRDARELARLARGYDVVVNDFHPSALGAPLTHGVDTPVVHVHGTNLWRSVTRPFRGTPWSAIDHVIAPALGALRDAGLARMVHDPLAPLGQVVRQGDELRLPPIVASPTRTRRRVREDLGIDPDDHRPLVVAYLNPYVRDRKVAASIEDACERLGAILYGVSEPFTARAAWRRSDPRLVDVIAAADAFVSSAGMGAVGQSRARGVPLLMLGSDQPEQRDNALNYLSLEDRPAADLVELGEPLEEPLARLLDSPRLARITPHAPTLWAGALRHLVRNA